MFDLFSFISGILLGYSLALICFVVLFIIYKRKIMKKEGVENEV